MRGLALDERTLRPVLATGTGGYSGPALKPIALAALFACRRASGLPIVGMGGVSTGRDALELVAAGATHVALGTVLFADPDAPARIRAELDSELERLGLDSLDAVRSVAQTGGVALPNAVLTGPAPS
jgi:dihydroorotate dehydrogenase (NAD+) catalytic subunit